MRRPIRWSTPPRWPPTADQRPAAARALVLCLPYPGFGASMYRRWPVIWDGVLFCPVQLPGRESRAAGPAPDELHSLAEGIVKELAPHLDRPFAFFGHGEAALLGYETTVRLCASGLPVPSRLYVSAQAAPHHGPHDRLTRMSREERAELVRRLVYQTRPDRAPVPLEAYQRQLDADLSALSRYRPIEAIELPCPIVAIGWNRDRHVDHADMRGWVECGRTKFVLLDGDHTTVVDPPATLLALLADSFRTGSPTGLSKVEGRCPPGPD